ncbi:MAG: hypothetical protein ABIJ39_11390 [Chloroflexota bacterium]
MGNVTRNPGEKKMGLIDFILRLIRGSKPPTTQPVIPPDSLTEPARMVIVRVLLIIYDPIVDPVTGITLSQLMKWNRVDDLVNGFIQDVLEASDGLARYQIVERVVLNEFPAKTDGYRYDPSAYLSVLKGNPPHKPEMADYKAILTGFNILSRVARREIDEVWTFAFPHAGFYESAMGGSGAFWCNAPPLDGSSDSPRRFVVMGFSYERGVGEMLEAFGHRVESILGKAFAKKPGNANLFNRFLLHEKEAAGKAEVGSIHFAPNSEKDYDWNNPRKVMSTCYDWFNFPNFRGDIREVNADEWGNGDIRAHHKWWLNHLPKVAGRMNGIANNWWQYIMDPNLVNL